MLLFFRKFSLYCYTVSPGSRAVMDDIRNRGSSGLSHSGTAAGGSKSFKRLQLMAEADDGI